MLLLSLTFFTSLNASTCTAFTNANLRYNTPFVFSSSMSTTTCNGFNGYSYNFNGAMGTFSNVVSAGNGYACTVTMTPTCTCPSGQAPDSVTGVCPAVTCPVGQSLQNGICQACPVSSNEIEVTGVSSTQCTGNNVTLDNGLNVITASTMGWDHCMQKCYLYETNYKSCAEIYPIKKALTCDTSKNDVHYSCTDDTLTGSSTITGSDTRGTYDYSCEPKVDPCYKVEQNIQSSCQSPNTITGECVSNPVTFVITSNTLKCVSPKASLSPCQALHQSLASTCTAPNYIVGTCSDDGTNILTSQANLYKCTTKGGGTAPTTTTITDSTGQTTTTTSGGVDSESTAGATSAINSVNDALNQMSLGMVDGINGVSDALSSSNSKLDSINSNSAEIASNTKNIADSLSSPAPASHTFDDGTSDLSGIQGTLTNSLGVTGNQGDILGLNDVGQYQLQQYSFSIWNHKFVIFDPSMMDSVPVNDIRNLFLMVAAIAGFLTIFRSI